MAFRGIMLLLGCGLFLAACAGQPRATVTPSPTPVTTDVFEVGGHVFGFTSPALMRDAGMTWVKFQVIYNRGDDPDSIKTLIDQAQAANFKVLLSVKGVPSEMSASSYNSDYAMFLGSIAAFKPDAIEVWNEANIDREWPTGQISGGNYTNLLKLAYAAIKAANADTLVISGAPAPTGFFSGKCTPDGCDDNIFLQQMVAAGAVNFMDCTGIHYNEGILPPDVRSGDPRENSSHYSRYFPAMLDLYTQAFPSKPLCFTEIGYLSPEGYDDLPPGFEWAANTTVQKQADWLGMAAQSARQSHRVRLLIIWNVDATEYGVDPLAGYAIVRPGGVCPACTTLGTAMNQSEGNEG
ncbi:MAG: hypothetical protein K8L97_25050 [Anaerolineae bacterium]|nr:hypothetical protein [Anaerolineae bacterium]